jgi:nucleoside-diphosphate-sugar epimerase
MSKVLVTGGAGYIGSVLCEQLLEAGHSVVCLDRFFFGQSAVAHLPANQRFSILRMDTRAIKREAFDGVDVVMDLAGISNDPASDLDENLTVDINYGGSARVMEMAAEAGVKHLIYSSSCSVYGAADNSALTEESEVLPVSLYAREKIRTESAIFAVDDSSMRTTVLRNGTVYGVSPRMRFDLIVNIMTAYAVNRGKVFVLGGGQQWRPLVHVRDVARAFMCVMDSEPDLVHRQVFNVGGSDQNFQVKQVAQLIRAAMPETVIEVTPDDPDKRSYNVNFDKIHDRLGFELQRSVGDGIEEVRDALNNGQISQDDIRTSTVGYYRYLLEAERVLDDLKIDGKLF